MKRFADAAMRLAGLAGVTFGWSPDAFWRATPTELDALVRALAGEEAKPLGSAELALLEERIGNG